METLRRQEPLQTRLSPATLVHNLKWLQLSAEKQGTDFHSSRTFHGKASWDQTECLPQFHLLLCPLLCSPHFLKLESKFQRRSLLLTACMSASPKSAPEVPASQDQPQLLQDQPQLPFSTASAFNADDRQDSDFHHCQVFDGPFKPRSQSLSSHPPKEHTESHNGRGSWHSK